jgi:hypothetical protein
MIIDVYDLKFIVECRGRDSLKNCGVKVKNMLYVLYINRKIFNECKI